MGDSLPEAFLQGAFDVLAGGAGALGDVLEGLPEGGLVEGVGTGGLGGELDHFLPAGLVGLLAVLVFALEDARLLAAIAALAFYRLEDLGEWRASSLTWTGIPLAPRVSLVVISSHLGLRFECQDFASFADAENFSITAVAASSRLG